MSSEFVTGVRAAAVANGTLTALLSTYRGEPAIFTGEVPDDAALPYLLIQHVTQIPGRVDVKNSAGRQPSIDIHCYTENTGSSILVEDIAEQVYLTYHRQSIAVTGFATIISSVDGPEPLDGTDVFGRVLTVTLTLEDTP